MSPQPVILIHWQAYAVPTGGPSQALVGMELDEVWELSWVPSSGVRIRFGSDGTSIPVEEVEVLLDRRQLVITLDDSDAGNDLHEEDLRKAGFASICDHVHATLHHGTETTKSSRPNAP